MTSVLLTYILYYCKLHKHKEQIDVNAISTSPLYSPLAITSTTSSRFTLHTFTAPTLNPSIPSHPAVHKLPSSQTLFDTQPHIPAPSPSQMPATPHVTMRHSKLHRAQVNHAAALEAIRLAQGEVAQAAQKAGLPPPPYPPFPSTEGAVREGEFGVGACW